MRVLAIIILLLSGASPAWSWTKTTSVSPVDDSTTVLLRQTADTPVQSRFSLRSSKPELFIRCMENTTALFIDYGFYLTIGELRVTSRVDKEPARTLQWRTSTDHEAVGLWRGGSSIPFIKSLIGKEQLFVRLTPWGEAPVSTTFSLVGLDEKIGEVAEACGWDASLATAKSSADTRTAVREAQGALNALGYNAGTADGVAGPQTRAAVTAFQMSVGLEPTGNLDAETSAALKEQLKDLQERGSEQASEKARAPAADRLAAILRSIEDLAALERERPAAPTTAGPATRRAPELADLIINQIAGCWRIDGGVEPGRSIKVPIRVRLSPSGEVIGEPAIQEPARYASDDYYRMSADAAVRAILRCAPLRLPPQDYDIWRDLVLTFDPREMF